MTMTGVTGPGPFNPQIVGPRVSYADPSTGAVYAPNGSLQSVVVSPIQGSKEPQPAFGGDAISLAQISVISGSPTVSVTTGPNN